MEKIRVGYARTEITPKESVPLAGYGNTLKRMSQGVLDPMYATCIAVTGSLGHTVILCSLDIIDTRDTYAPAARRSISEKWGIPVENVILAATHTHSGPDTNQKDYPPIARYMSDLIEKLTELAGLALEDRHPATMECGRTHNEGMNYVRHYILENDTVCGDNFGNPKLAPYRGHVSEADREIRLVKILREGAPDILIVNWQAHPTMASTISTEYGRAHRPLISADYVGACRDYVEEKTGMRFIYFQGAAGNINARSRLEWEQDTREHIPYGQQLGDYILDGLKDLQPLSGTKVAAATDILHGRMNHTEDHLVPQAEMIYDEWKKTSDYRHCADMAEPYGIQSPFHAGAIIRKAALPESMDIGMGAVRIGGLGCAVMPYEAFDTNGKFVREGSPFEMTLIISCANGRFGYFPSESAFAHGCYEAYMCTLAPGIAEDAAQMALNLLKGLHEDHDE